MRALPAIAALALGAVLAAPAGAQLQAPPEPVGPPEPGPPKVIVSYRDARLTPASTALVRLGCLGRTGELCVGTVTLRLAKPLLIPQPDLPARGNQPARPRPPKRINPFTLGSARFGVAHGYANAYRVRVSPVMRALLRLVGRATISVTVEYAGMSGVAASASRTILLYVPRR